MKKIVMMPLRVPDSAFCWDGEVACDHFDNEGGHATCDVGFDQSTSKEGFILKDAKCDQLQEKR